MSIRDILNRWSRDRDQETVELAEAGIAPEDEVEAVEERVAEHRHEHDQPPGDGPAD
jgi:hypothetical protein